MWGERKEVRVTDHSRLPNHWVQEGNEGQSSFSVGRTEMRATRGHELNHRKKHHTKGAFKPRNQQTELAVLALCEAKLLGIEPNNTPRRSRQTRTA